MSESNHIYYGSGKRLLIADAGSTKTRVVILSRENHNIIEELNIDAINPIHLTDEELQKRLSPIKQLMNNDDDIAFFGAGCLPGESSMRVKKALSREGSSSTVNIFSDIVAAGLSLFGVKEGIACIVGTGSNTSYFKDGEIVSSVPALGYILGDEGSGASLGKRLLRQLFRNEYSVEMREEFERSTNQTIKDVIENVYRKPTPNKYLAQFTHFIADNIDNHHIRKLVREEFTSLFTNQISRYPDYRYIPIGFIGSVAKVFEEHVRHVASDFQCNIVAVYDSPMQGLIDYFKQNKL